MPGTKNKLQIAKILGALLIFSGFCSFFAIPLIHCSSPSTPSVKLWVKKNKVILGEKLLLELKIIEPDTSYGEPEIKFPDNMRVESTSRSSRISIINEKFSSTVEYEYQLTPTKSGTYSIGPAILTLKDGTRIQSNTVTIKVISKEDIDIEIIETKIEKKEAFLGEPVKLTAILRHRADHELGLEYRDKRTQDFDLVRIPSHTQKSCTNIKGSEYKTCKIHAYVFVHKAGRITFKPEISNYGGPLDFFRRFFSNKEDINLQLNSVKILGKPLPDKNVPKDFSGIVGRYFIYSQVISSVNVSNVLSNDLFILKVTVIGNGNPNTFPNLVDHHINGNFKTVKIEEKIKISEMKGTLAFIKTYELYIRPQKGKRFITIEPVSFTYFDPWINKFTRAKSKSISIDTRVAKTTPLY